MAGELKKIKILFTIPNFDTAGSGKALLKIAQRLDPDIFHPEIMCFHGRGEFFKEVEKTNIPIHLFEYTSPMKPRIEGLKNCWIISRQFKHINPDIIHSFHYSPDYSEPMAAKFAGIPWVYTKKNMNWGGTSKNSWNLRTFLAKKVIIINSEMSRFLPKQKMVLIYRGVDLDEFNQKSIDLTLIEELGIKKSKKIILCVANLVPVKGCDVLIKAFSINAKERDDLILLIVGDDKNGYGSTLKELANNLGLSSRVLFTGKRLDVNRFYSISDLLVYPTKKRGEGFGLALTESMASGVVAIGSNVAGIRDQLSGLENQMFNPEDPHDLSIKIQEFLDCLNKDEIILNQISRVQDQFTINMEVRKHELLYKKVVGY